MGYDHLCNQQMQNALNAFNKSKLILLNLYNFYLLIDFNFLQSQGNLKKKLLCYMVGCKKYTIDKDLV